ncbi:MAG: DUF393 domain-containing protein [Candidatus Margulisbacteria bacterium]|nr:DUF393 domain-containing protein [Candidatus Margulisiibacteriota bacterium]
MGKIEHIVFYDGVCAMCNGVVKFVLAHSKENNIYFSALQSDFAQKVLSEKEIASLELNTFYYYNKGEVYAKSEGVVRLCQQLNGIYYLLSYGKWMPLIIRGWMYSLVVRSRYRIFGKYDNFLVPDEKTMNLFLEASLDLDKLKE